MKRFRHFSRTLSLGASILAYACSTDTTSDASIEFNPGEWPAAEYETRLLLTRTVHLKPTGDGFILKINDLKYRDQKFYIVDRLESAVIIYDSIGTYLESIPVDVEAHRTYPLKRIFVQDELLFVKRDEALYVVNTEDGELAAAIHTPRPSSAVKPIIAGSGGLEIIAENSAVGYSIFSSIYETYPLARQLQEEHLVAKFAMNGEIAARFAKHLPIVAEYALFSFSNSYFTLWANELYLIEEGFPTIRVYSLEGELQRSFGEVGRHQRVIDRPPPSASSMEALKQYILRYSHFTKIFAIPKVEGYAGPVVAVCYFNSPMDLDAIEQGERPANNLISEYYLMLYTPGGTLLLNDLPLPGELLDLDDSSRLVIQIDATPTNRMIGIYELSITDGGR